MEELLIRSFSPPAILARRFVFLVLYFWLSAYHVLFKSSNLLIILLRSRAFKYAFEIFFIWVESGGWRASCERKEDE